MGRIVKIFDTTLRDGEQSPGASMNGQEKLAIARQLVKLGVDIIEAGFAYSSHGDFEAIKTICGEVEGPIICSLARAKEEDIKAAYEALQDATQKRIHTFLSTSDIHLKHQFHLSREEALARAVKMVEFAKGLVDDVEFSAMDATRTDLNYLCEVIEAVIEAGARTVNIPDTVGYTIPNEFGAMISTIFMRVQNIKKAAISVHCHNDLGLAVANSLVAVYNGVKQIECTINGIGERAGNCSLEEVVMVLKTRKDLFRVDTNITTEEIMRSSRLVTKITGISVQPNKAIVGANAFAHESGIHQDGLIKERSTYEIIRPESIGLTSAQMILGKHSGRKVIKKRLEELGYKLTDEQINKAFGLFKDLADKKKQVFNEDIETIVDNILGIEEVISLVDLFMFGSINQPKVVMVRLKLGRETRDRLETGNGPVDAAFKAIAFLTKTESTLLDFDVENITPGVDSQGEVKVVIKEGKIKIRGRGSDTDIIVASAKAYINALNRLEMRKRNGR